MSAYLQKSFRTLNILSCAVFYSVQIEKDLHIVLIFFGFGVVHVTFTHSHTC